MRALMAEFCTFHVRYHASKKQPNFWTGMCLSELHNILQQDAWTCCMHTRDSRSSPKSLWGCTTLGMALDRAHLDRGHAKLSGDRPTGWDLPVAIGAWWPPPRLELHQPLSNGSLVVHVPVHDPDEEKMMTRLPLDSLNWSMGSSQWRNRSTCALSDQIAGHQQHKREKSANYWRRNTPTTGAAAERRNKRKHAQMKHPERRTLNNKKKKVRQTFNNLWITMLQMIADKVGLPQQYWREKNRTDSAVTMEERKAGIALMKKLDATFGGLLLGHSQH